MCSGKVLVTGGFAVVNGALGISNVTELYDPATGTWTAGPDLPFIVYSHVQITLPSGRVFITSGYAPLQSEGPAVTAAAHPPARAALCSTAVLWMRAVTWHAQRSAHAVMRVDGGMCAGNGDYDFNHDSVLYDEATNAFIPTAVPLELYQGFDQSSLVDTDAVLFRASA